MDDASVVIVGAGHAGARAVEALRKGGWKGAIVMIGAEGGVPYERPPVSKALLFGEAQAPRPLWTGGAERPDVAVIPGHVTAIDRAARKVAVADGARHRYTYLILATGSRPRRLPQETISSERVFHLRTAADAARLRPLVRRGARLLIVGAGLIGLEVASGARSAGLEVCVVEMAPRALGRAVPEAVARAVLAQHVAHGVEIRTGASVASVRDTASDVVVTFADGSRDRFDIMLVAAGVVPRTELAAAAGLAVENGIAVDATLATADPHIFAAGDVANFPHTLFGRRLRLESQQNADDHGRHVARRILGSAAPFEAVPWFWSDQFDATLQVAGIPEAAATMVERPMEGGQCTLHFAANGRLVGAAAFGPPAKVGREIGAARRLIAQRATVSPERAANPHIELREAISASLTPVA